MEDNEQFGNLDIQSEVLRKRKRWSGQFEYILSLFGYMSGAGDFWRFPYLFWKNGGGKYHYLN